jgi:hypothetical protein
MGPDVDLSQVKSVTDRLDSIENPFESSLEILPVSSLHFVDRLIRAGAGRRSGSGWRQGRVRWGRPLLSRPRGAVGSGAAAVESAAVSGHEAFIRQYMSTLTADFASYIRSTIHQLQPASSFATWSCLYSAIQTRLDFWLQHLTPEETEATCHAVDAELRDAVEALTYHGAICTRSTSQPPASMTNR